MSEIVNLYCIKVGSKLRVRVSTEGYLRNANCQFPRDLRVDGRKYAVEARHINLIRTRGKYFYSVKNKSAIKILDGSDETSTDKKITVEHVYTDDTMEDCIVCMEKPKDSVIAPCGHFYACECCTKAMKQCPICRGPITEIIKSSEFGTDE